MCMQNLMALAGIHYTCSLLAGARTRPPDLLGDVCVPCFCQLITSWTSELGESKFYPTIAMKFQECQVSNLTIIMKPVSHSFV